MRKNVPRRAKGALGRVAAAGLAAVLALGVAVSGPVAASALEATPGGSLTTGDGVTLTKLASWDETTEDRANVQLSVGSTEEVVESYVTFVIDKSTSFDVRDEANKMLEELLEQTTDGTIVNVSVVSFENSADVIQEWTVLNESTIGDIQSAIENKRSDSGTNIQMGLATARELLSGVSGHKYLVLLTDGITYQWGNGQTIYTEQASNGEESLNAGNDMNGVHHPDLEAYYAEFSNVAQWMASHGTAIAQDIQTYGRTYTVGQIQPSNGKGNQTNSTYEGFDEANYDYVKYEDATEHYSANDAAVYSAVAEWRNLANDGVTLFAYADSTGDPNTKGSNAYNAKNNPWAAAYIASLDTVAGTSGMVEDGTVEGMFDGVMNTVLYEIASGTVNDTIGADFDLAGLDTIKLTVGGVDIPGTVDEENNTVTFDDGHYVVTYNPNAPAGETLTWNITVPVKSAEPVTLSYALDLSNKAAEAGTYQVPTNEDASISYKSTDGGSGAEKFPVPVLEYTVEEPAPVTPDPITVSGDVFNVTKVLEGATLKDGQFEFQLADADGNVIATATNDAEGNVVFDDFTFEAAGTYEYTVSEVLPTDDDPNTDGVQKDGVTYDQTVEGLKLEVTEKDGKLTCQAYTDEDGATFNNVYKAAEAPAEDTKPADDTKKDETVPSTGDPTSFAAVAATLVAGVGAGAAGIAMRRRNK
ncbi:MAG TPA: hypothetical protein DD645_02815 [Olsenella sp.]|nr:hypothetical protein [Olsenella sp.]